MPIKTNKSLKGFTVAEIMIVIVIIGILLVITLPRMGGGDFFDRLRLRTTAHQIASDIRYTRRLSIAQEAHTIRFNFGQSTYMIYPTASSQDQIIKTIPAEVRGSGQNRFSFGRLGEPTRGGGRTVTLTTGGHQRTITVEAVSGVVSIQ
jgi:prepilin-type N-terminal cleavage/methylation domain-containing protein